jgi:hypothetical protein
VQGGDRAYEPNIPHGGQIPSRRMRDAPSMNSPVWVRPVSFASASRRRSLRRQDVDEPVQSRDDTLVAHPQHQSAFRPLHPLHASRISFTSGRGSSIGRLGREPTLPRSGRYDLQQPIRRWVLELQRNLRRRVQPCLRIQLTAVQFSGSRSGVEAPILVNHQHHQKLAGARRLHQRTLDAAVALRGWNGGMFSDDSLVVRRDLDRPGIVGFENI